jgi:hypothetical protein
MSYADKLKLAKAKEVVCDLVVHGWGPSLHMVFACACLFGLAKVKDRVDV